ncbi:MAG: 3-oxoacyl-ACP synthase [Bacteroidales bacterium]|nr:3-oxoacyl-ACP synthase [Bacteroidales bacterium]
MKNKYSIYQKGHSIISPLACGSSANFEAIAAGKSQLRSYGQRWGIPEPFFASVFEDDNSFGDIVPPKVEMSHGTFPQYTRFEKLAIKAAEEAIRNAEIDASGNRVLFILSTTKGNVELLEHLGSCHDDRPYLWYSAQLIAQHFGNQNTPIVASNACISGCAAQIAAYNMLQYSNQYDYVVVVGAEVLSKFIISGFQSFKALSPERCKPFDANRCGLNLGEAGAAIVYARTDKPEELADSTIIMEAGAINNDANHISGPSRTGEGLLRSIRKVTKNFDTQRIAFINAHGTATLYNDDMESVAINRAGLQDIPVNSLKGYYGHTLGAAGVMEVILSSIALQKHMAIKSLGTEQPGTVQALNVCMENHEVQGDAFLKLISGFGGSNAAVLFSLRQGSVTRGQGTVIRIHNSQFTIHNSVVLPQITIGSQGIDDQLAQLYRNIGMSYPKFFKMDRLCKAGILGAEMLLKDYDFDHENVKADWGIVLMNSASSLDNDRRYQETIATDNYYPSPAVFVYTLANIVTGEIAIRHKIGGESSFYVMPEYKQELIEEIIGQAFTANPELTHIVCGWVDVDGENCEVKMGLYKRMDNAQCTMHNAQCTMHNEE